MIFPMNGKSYSGTLCPLFLSLSPEVKRLRKKLFRDTLSVFAILYSYIEYLSCICYRQILWITGGRTAIPPACGDPSGVFCQRGKGAKQPNHRGRGRSSSRVTSRHFDHGNGSRAFTFKLFRSGWGQLTKRKNLYVKPRRAFVAVGICLAQPACSAARCSRQSG